MMTTQMYDAQATSIAVEDITTNIKNGNVLRRIMRNENRGDDLITSLYILNRHDEEDGDDCMDYVPEGAIDMGWLGYFIGKNNHLEELCFRHFGRLDNIDVIKPFFRGVNNNKSITTLNFDGIDLLGGKIFTMMDLFFKNNGNLDTLNINSCDFGDEESRALALALGSCKSSSLTKLFLVSNDLECVDIITALSMHPNLQVIDFEDNRLGRNGCIALATLLEHSVPQLQVLDIGGNQIDDECIDVLVPALKTCRNLEILRLYSSPSITAKGWQKLASILESPNSRIKELNLLDNNVLGSGDALALFAKPLVNNHRLMTLSITGMSTGGETERAFSNLLCDVSSANSTFESNHTLRHMFNHLGAISRTNPLRPLLELNENEDKKVVAMIKILQHHNDINMTPFYEWEFKVLPLMIDWLERASSITMPEDYEPNIGQRKLSSIYQFVRGMPDLYVETYLMKELEDIKAARKQKQEELVILEERQKSIMKRLGQQRGAAA